MDWARLGRPGPVEGRYTKQAAAGRISGSLADNIKSKDTVRAAGDLLHAYKDSVRPCGKSEQLFIAEAAKGVIDSIRCCRLGTAVGIDQDHTRGGSDLAGFIVDDLDGLDNDITHVDFLSNVVSDLNVRSIHCII